MPALTRRRYPERHDCWHVYYGDVHVGTIARRTGNPHDTDTWEWRCDVVARERILTAEALNPGAAFFLREACSVLGTPV
jgi:hypothetical protein